VRASHARVAAAAAAALAAGALCAGCGETAKSVDVRQFSANTADVIAQLHGDLASAAAVGDLRDARRALRHPSDLYPLLMAFADLGGCDAMRRNAGNGGPRFGRVEATLRSACRFLERGSRLFTTAATRSDAAALLAAARTTALASPLLYRAEAELVAAGGRGP
jgi:hypothetical protein